MFKLLICVLAAFVSCSMAKPDVVAAPFAYPYANAPLYAAGGSNQVDVRNNYDGTLSSYATEPFNYAAAAAQRYVSGVPAAHFAAAYASPYAAAPYAAAPFGVPAPLAAAAAPFAPAPYPYVV